jgi:hypothetical protein
MSEVIKCDRCGKIEWNKISRHHDPKTDKPVGTVSGTVLVEVCPDTDRNSTGYGCADLCPDCEQALKDLLFEWWPKFKKKFKETD